MTERMVKAVMKALLWIRAIRGGSIDIIMKNGRLDQRAIGASLYDLMRDAFIPGLSPEGLYKRAELEFAVLKEKPNFKPEQEQIKWRKKLSARLKPIFYSAPAGSIPSSE